MGGHPIKRGFSNCFAGGHSIKLPSKYFLFLDQCSSQPSSEKFFCSLLFLQWKVVNAKLKAKEQRTCDCAVTSTKEDTGVTPSPFPWLREHQGRGVRKNLRARVCGDSCKTVSFGKDMADTHETYYSFGYQPKLRRPTFHMEVGKTHEVSLPIEVGSP